MATFSWVAAAPFAGLDITKYPNIMSWMDRIYARPAVKEGLSVPEPSPLAAALSDRSAMEKMIKAGQESWLKKPE
jgi:glutathione S-transferase